MVPTFIGRLTRCDRQGVTRAEESVPSEIANGDPRTAAMQPRRCQMIELECPWCEESCRMDASAFGTAPVSVRCDGCGVEVEITDAPARSALALAA